MIGFLFFLILCSLILIHLLFLYKKNVKHIYYIHINLWTVIACKFPARDFNECCWIQMKTNYRKVVYNCKDDAANVGVVGANKPRVRKLINTNTTTTINTLQIYLNKAKICKNNGENNICSTNTQIHTKWFTYDAHGVKTNTKVTTEFEQRYYYYYYYYYYFTIDTETNTIVCKK